jgi:hypothetical protein
MIGSIIGLILVYLAYVYLRNLSDCSCVNQIYVERLKNIEALILTLSLVSLITSIIIGVFMSDLYGSIEKFKKYILFGFSLLALFMIVVYSYFIYDAYMFSSTMGVPCTCANGWQKYYIYFQATVMVLIVLGSISTGIKLAMNPSALFSSPSPSTGYKGKKYRRKNKRSRR